MPAREKQLVFFAPAFPVLRTFRPRLSQERTPPDFKRVRRRSVFVLLQQPVNDIAMGGDFVPQANLERRLPNLFVAEPSRSTITIAEFPQGSKSSLAFDFDVVPFPLLFGQQSLRTFNGTCGF